MISECLIKTIQLYHSAIKNSKKLRLLLIHLWLWTMYIIILISLFVTIIVSSNNNNKNMQNETKLNETIDENVQEEWGPIVLFRKKLRNLDIKSNNFKTITSYNSSNGYYIEIVLQNINNNWIQFHRRFIEILIQLY